MDEDKIGEDPPITKMQKHSSAKENRKILKEEIKRTGVTPRIFFEKKFFLHDPQRPITLDRRMMNLVLAGKLYQPDQIIIDYIFKKYSALADDVGRKSKDGVILPRRGRQFPKEGEEWITITKEMLHLLVSEFNRTGISPHTVLNEVDAIPDRLNSRMIQGWYYSHITKTNSIFWNFVIGILEKSPDVDLSSYPIKKHKPYKIPKNRSGHEFISDEARKLLQDERERTGFGAAVLLKYAKDDIPKGLTFPMISGWISGKTTTADPDHFKYVLDLYETLPTRK